MSTLRVRFFLASLYALIHHPSSPIPNHHNITMTFTADTSPRMPKRSSEPWGYSDSAPRQPRRASEPAYSSQDPPIGVKRRARCTDCCCDCIPRMPRRTVDARVLQTDSTTSMPLEMLVVSGSRSPKEGSIELEGAFAADPQDKKTVIALCA